MANRKVQPVSFNLSDPFEADLLNHATSKGAFSKYIKRLIQRDKEGIFKNPDPVQPLNKKGNAKSFL